MKVVTTTVSLYGYHDASNQALQKRLMAYELAHKEATLNNADLLCLPGGYFYYKLQKFVDDPFNSNDGLKKLRGEIVGLAKKHKTAIAVGLDLDEKDQTCDNSEAVREGRLPWYAICWSPSEDVIHCWNQRSVNSKYQWDCPQNLCDEVRAIQIGKNKVEIILCGEAFNSRIKDEITLRSEKPVALVDLAHTLSGFRVTWLLKSMAERGVHAFCCGHAEKQMAMKHYFAPEFGKLSSYKPDFTCGPMPRIEGKVWVI
jgi:hypothetical protein